MPYGNRLNIFRDLDDFKILVITTDLSIQIIWKNYLSIMNTTSNTILVWNFNNSETTYKNVDLDTSTFVRESLTNSNLQLKRGF